MVKKSLEEYKKEKIDPNVKILETEAKSQAIVDKLEKFVEIYDRHLSPEHQKEIHTYYEDDTGIPTIVELGREVKENITGRQGATQALLKADNMEETLNNVGWAFDMAKSQIELYAVRPDGMTRLNSAIAEIRNIPDDVADCSRDDVLDFLEQKQESGPAFHALSKAMPELESLGLKPRFVKENMPNPTRQNEINFGSI